MNKLNSYLCYCDYGATGEGNHIWLSLEYATDKESARIKFQKRFKLDDYFIIGTEVISTNNKKVKEILNIYFNERMTKYFLEVIQHNAGDFQMQFDANFS